MATDKPIRILTCYYRPKPGGFCTRYFRAINALLDNGCEVHYLAVTRFPILHSRCYFHRFPWPEGKSDSLFFWALFHAFAPVFLLYFGFRWKITRCFAFGTTYGCFLQPLRVIKKIPLVLFLRGDAIEHHRSKNRHEWLIRIEMMVEGLAIQGVSLYSVSDFLVERVIARHRRMRPGSVKVLRNNIDLRTLVCRQSGGSVLRVGCVGMLESHKNQSLLIDTLYKMRTTSIELGFFGVGPDRHQLVSMAERFGVQSRVRFRGWVDSTQIWNEIDLLLMPSLYEGCPNAVLEAMGNSIPVLASDIPPHREILPKTNLLPLGDIEAWCIRLQSIAEDKQRELPLIVKSQSESMQSMVFDWGKFVCDAITGLNSTTKQ